MKEVYSKTEDTIWLTKQLKEALKGRISTTYVIDSGILTGKYIIGDTWVESSEIDFTIEYNKDEFLRINVGQHQQDESYTKKIKALKALGEAIINVDIAEEKKIGQPLAFYIIATDTEKVPYLEWAFSKKKEWKKALEDGTLFDDAIPEDLIFIDKSIETTNVQNSQKDKIKTIGTIGN